MKPRFEPLAALLCAVVICGSAWAQSALLPVKDMAQLFGRCLQLMESSTVAIPELARAGAPLIENTRQASATLRKIRGQNTGLTYTFLVNLRAYLALADAVPKPYPFPEEARKQLAELRDSSDRVESHFRALLDLKESQIRPPDRDNTKRYAEANARQGPADKGKPRIVFMGDSITDGWRLNEYFPDQDFVNRGISGQITGEMLGRMKADVLDLKPQAVLILAGTNDLALNVPITVIENNYAMMADLAEFEKIKVIFASVLPISDYHKDRDPSYEQTLRRQPGLIRTLNNWLENFCANHGYTYLDYYSALVDKSGMLGADLADDGLHPNPAGYRLMAPLAQAAIDKLAPQPKQAPEPAKKRRFFGISK